MTMKTLAHASGLAVALASSLWASAAVAQTCETVKACYQSAQSALVEIVSPIAAQPAGKCSVNGCVRVQVKLTTPATTLDIPYAEGLFTQVNASVPTITARADGPMAATNLPLWDGANPAEGLTIIINYPTGASVEPIRSLAAVTDADGHPLVALGVQARALLYGRRGLNGAEGWVPVWDPDVLPRLAPILLVLRFDPHGKVQIDAIQGYDLAHLTWSSNLLDVGWPITAFPTGHDPKVFLKPAGLQIGQLDWARLPKTRMSSGVTEIDVYKRPLLDRELLALWATGTIKAALPDADLAFHPCNTGAYLSDTSTTGARTPCGTRTSVLAPITFPPRFHLRDSSGYYWSMPNPPGRIFTSDDSDYATTFTAEKMGANNFVLRNTTGFLVRQSDQDVISSTQTLDPRADQYWHVVTESGGEFGRDLRILSLGNGGYIGLEPASDYLHLARVDMPWRVEAVTVKKRHKAAKRLAPIHHPPASAEDREADN